MTKKKESPTAKAKAARKAEIAKQNVGKERAYPFINVVGTGGKPVNGRFPELGRVAFFEKYQDEKGEWVEYMVFQPQTAAQVGNMTPVQIEQSPLAEERIRAGLIEIVK